MTFAQNDIILGAVKVTPNPNIKPIDPLRRNCYFDYEHPPCCPLKAHEKYSQVIKSFTIFENPSF